LQERGVRLEFVLDEGGAVIEDLPMGVKKPAAMIGLAEKGYADFLVSVVDAGGHAAEPPRNTALGKLAKALVMLEKMPMKQRLISPVTLSLTTLGHHVDPLKRIFLTNLRIFKPLVMRILAGDKQTNALTRTTIAATMAEASPAPNVLPQRAKATLNTRILPGETANDVETHIRRVADKAGIPLEIELLRYAPAVEERAHGWAYQVILRCLPTICKDIIPLPYLVTGATDSREYAHISDEIYRFYPFFLNSDELSAMHATNERIRRESLAGALRFNYQFIKEVGSGTKGSAQIPENRKAGLKK
jgi:carboxypeptidase PM20D1